jgi:CRP-like cAMP-binding protein
LITKPLLTPLSNRAVRVAPPAIADEHFRLLKNSKLFRGIPEREGRALVDLSKFKVFQRNELIFTQGQPVNQLLLVESGGVKLAQIGPKGGEVIVWVRGPGEMIGSTDLFSQTHHTCSTRALARCTALTWDMSVVQREVQHLPVVKGNIGSILFEQLQDLESRFFEIATERVSHRVALTILRTVNILGTPCNRGVEIQLTQKELAQMASTNVFSISRLMRSWEEQGIVVVGKRAFVILDVSGLETASQILEFDDR